MAKKRVVGFKNVSKIYKLGGEEVRAVDKVNLDIFKGEYIALMGPSGSGKSTFLNLLGCLDTPTKGEIFLEGKEVSKLSEEELARIRSEKIGFVFQSYNLLARLSALENVEIPLIYKGIKKEEREKRALLVLKEVGLEERKNHTPSQLSGGQQQRVAIARALVNEPAVILADEPTGNLDTKSGKEIMEIFKKIHKQGKTLVVVTHDKSIARYAGKIVRLIDGRIKEGD